MLTWAEIFKLKPDASPSTKYNSNGANSDGHACNAKVTLGDDDVDDDDDNSITDRFRCFRNKMFPNLANSCRDKCDSWPHYSHLKDLKRF